jgi:hypothetical protein
MDAYFIEISKRTAYADAPYTDEIHFKQQNIEVWMKYLNDLADAAHKEKSQANTVDLKNGNYCYLQPSPTTTIISAPTPGEVMLPKVRMHDVESTNGYWVRIVEPGSFHYSTGEKIQVSHLDLVPQKTLAYAANY